jgi:hypothetical protein
MIIHFRFCILASFVPIDDPYVRRLFADYLKYRSA